MTTEEFIQKSILIHGDKYDYSKTVYVNNLKEVIITCKEHGDFLQLPKVHKRGCGCSRCGSITKKNKKTMTTQTFIEKAKLIHGDDKYDYSKVYYKTARENVIIICRIHGEFEQTPALHLCGSGCQACGIIKMKDKQTKTLGAFINEAQKIH